MTQREACWFFLGFVDAAMLSTGTCLGVLYNPLWFWMTAIASIASVVGVFIWIGDTFKWFEQMV